MPLPTVYEALQAIIDAAEDQPAPLQDLCEAAAIGKAVLARDSATRSKRLKGRAGRKTKIDYDLVEAMAGRNCSVDEIREAAGASATRVRVHLAKIRKATTVTPAKKSPAGKRGKKRGQ